jgi:hypothetical protein
MLYTRQSIYKSTVTLKITAQQQTVLKSESLPEVNILNSDRFIANEIEVIENLIPEKGLLKPSLILLKMRRIKIFLIY